MKFKYLLIAAVINILSKKVRYWGELTLKGYKIIPHGQKLFKFGITLKKRTSAVLKYIFTSTVPCNSSWMYCIKILCRFVVHLGYLTSIEPISYYPKDIKLRSILTLCTPWLALTLSPLSSSLHKFSLTNLWSLK